MLIDEKALYDELVDAGLLPDVPYNAASTQELAAVRRVVAGLNAPLVRTATQIYDKLERLSAEQKPYLRRVGYASVYIVGTIYKGVPGRQYTIKHTDAWKSPQMPWALQWNAVLGEEGQDEVVTGQDALLDLGNTFPQDWESGSDTPEEAMEELRRNMIHQIERESKTSVMQTLLKTVERLAPFDIPRVCLIGESMGGPFEWRVVAGDVVESEQEAEQKGAWVTATEREVGIGFMDPHESPGDAIAAFGESVQNIPAYTLPKKHKR